VGTFWALVVGALQGLAALPKILDKVVGLEVDGRIGLLAANAAKVKEAFDALDKAQTTEEKANAADQISSFWNSRGVS